MADGTNDASETTIYQYWLTQDQEEAWLAHAKETPFAGLIVFGACCWLWVIAHSTAPPMKGDVTIKQNSYRKTLWAQSVVAAVHCTSALVLGTSLLLNDAVGDACAGKVFCWSPRLQLSMESMLGYLLFECFFSAFKAKRWLLPYGWAEDAMLFMMVLMQRVYPCVAVVLVFPWWCVLRGCGLLWAVDHILAGQVKPMWNARFINEMARTTVMVAKLGATAVLAFQMTPWVWSLELAQYPLPHGLSSWSWPYSYTVTACLVFHCFVSFKQLQGAIRMTMHTIKTYERLHHKAAEPDSPNSSMPDKASGKQLSGAQRRKALKNSREIK